MEFKTNILDWVAIVIAVLALFFAPILPHGQSAFGAVGGTTTLNNLGISQLKIGSNCNDGFKYGSCSGTSLNSVTYGTCVIFAYATTIAASSTATVDCQSGASSLTALSGVQSGDTVMAHATTTLSSTFEGVNILSYAASTTNGYITMTLYNGTGGTFTWTGTASSSISYIDIR